ncbi:MAG: site-specific integrase [Cyclobacteriaceae bacterium]|nr:site-specific integrase [Cyclobacteriaceae bacterium]
MATSIAVVLRKKKSKSNTYPLAIRITKNGKSTYMYLGKSVEENHWDPSSRKVKTSHPNSGRLNNFIKKKLIEAEDILLEAQSSKNDASPTQIKTRINTGGESASFFELAEEYMDNLTKTGKHNQVSSNRPRIKHFKEFLNGNDISVKEITVPMLDKYILFLQTEYSNSQTSIYNKLNIIRIVYNMAKERGIVDGREYPFGKNKIKMRPGKSSKIGLTEAEIKEIEKLELTEGTGIWHTRNVFLFSFYFAGMRVSDVLNTKWSNIIDGRLHYTMGKNSKPGSVRLPEKVKPIINAYKNDQRSKDDFIFPELKKADLTDKKDVFRKIRTASKKFGNYLKTIAEKTDIDKNMSMHIARHSFGNISKGQIPPDILQMLYRHTHISTTINYQNNFIHDKTDAALDEIVNF